jgi:hypothetical protein
MLQFKGKFCCTPSSLSLAYCETGDVIDWQLSNVCLYLLRFIVLNGIYYLKPEMAVELKACNA